MAKSDKLIYDHKTGKYFNPLERRKKKEQDAKQTQETVSVQEQKQTRTRSTRARAIVKMLEGYDRLSAKERRKKMDEIDRFIDKEVK